MLAVVAVYATVAAGLASHRLDASAPAVLQCGESHDGMSCGAATCGEAGGAQRGCVFDRRSNVCKCPVACGEYTTPLSCTAAISPKDGRHCLLFDRDHTEQQCISLVDANLNSCEDIGTAAAAANIRAPVSHVCELAYSPQQQHLKCVWSRDTLSCTSPSP